MLVYTSIENIPTIVDNLRKQFNTGLTKDINFRKQQLSNLIRFFEENRTTIEQALWKDLHKHKIESIVGEIAPVVNECKYMIENLDNFAKPTYTKKRYLMNTTDKTYIRKEAKGVVLVIGAWNYPVNLLLLPLVGAIAAGNCVLIKPSEVSENTAQLIADLLPKYLDSRAYSVVNGGVSETTAVLEQRFDHIFFTGSGPVGKIIMTAATKFLTPITLELGGKSPVFVTSDADINITAHRLMWGKCFNSGQTCIAPDYVLCVKEKVDALIKALAEVVKEYYGENPQESESYCRIVSHRQFDRLKGMLDNCRPNTIVVGGKTNREDRYIEPTVVYPVTADDDNVMAQEIFGPILPIIPVDNVDEAIEIVNASDQPLSLYIFSSSTSTYNYILNRTNSGGALVNDTLMHFQETSLPFGGVGPSGTGAYHGKKSFDTFTHERSTMIKDTSFESMSSVRYPPYNQDKANIVNVFIYGFPAGIGSKVSTFFSVSGSFRNSLFSKNQNLKSKM